MNAADLNCKCCGLGKERVSMRLVSRLAALEREVGAKLAIHSAFRCPKHNAAVGGKRDSQHLLGRACDFHLEGHRSPEDLKEIRAKMLGLGFTGVGLYANDGAGWVHGDVRDLAANEPPHLW